VITLQIIHDIRRPERLVRLMEELAMQGIDNAIIREGTINGPTVEASITKSHKDIIRWAKESGLKEVAVAEDDLMFADQNSWKYFLDNKPESFDLYLAGAYGMNILRETDSLLWVKSFQGLHCYICTEKYYDTFLGLSDTGHIDVEQEGKGQFAVCRPMVGFQRPGFSATARKEVNYNGYDIHFPTDQF